VNRPIKVFVFLAFSLFTLNSCRNEAIKVDPHFMGIWAGTNGGTDYHLSIDNRSDGYWEKASGANIQYVRGVARIKHNELFIGLKELDINWLPMQDSTGAWNMSLDGVVYRKQ
jgi:hypothetical protein